MNKSGEYTGAFNQLKEYVKSKLNFFTEMKLLEQVDDVLYLHGELSLELIKFMKEKDIDGINQEYQQALKNIKNEPEKFIKISDKYNSIFSSQDYSNNTLIYHLNDITDYLKSRGINKVIHGHTPFDYNSKHAHGIIFNGVEIFNTDIAMSRGMNGKQSKPGGVRIPKNEKGHVFSYNPEQIIRS